jgi:hypothetical protein
MEETYIQGDWAYRKDIESNRITISKYLGSGMEAVVPAQINGIKVCCFDPFVFLESPGNVSVKRVVLSEGIERIGSMALALSSVREIIFPTTMQSIDKTGFNETIKRFTVDRNNPYFFDIDGVLFSRKQRNTHLVLFPSGRDGTYRIPDGTTQIDRYAFNICKKLERVIMPDSVVSLDHSAFISCPNLSSVRLSQNIEELRGNTFYNCAALSDVRSFRKIKTISPNAFKDCPKFEEINIQTRIPVQER